MDPKKVDAALRRGVDLLRKVRILDAQHAFYEAVDAAGKDPEIKRAAAEFWRKAGWAATMGNDDPESGWTMFHNARALYLSLNGGGSGRLYEVERGMAIAASKMGEHEEALRSCDDAEAHASSDEERCKVWNTRAVGLSILGRDDEAWTWAYKVLAVSRDEDTLRVARQTLGILLIKKGRPQKALRYLQDEVLRAWAHVEAGEYREALEVAPRDRPRGYTIRARAWLGLGKPDRAIAELRRGARIIEQGRARLDTEAARAAFQGSRQEVHSFLVGLCAGRKRWAEAFTHAEEGRARSFLDFVVVGRRRDLSHLRPSERRRFERLREEIESLQKEAVPGRPPRPRLEKLETEYLMSLRRYEKERLAGGQVQPRRPLKAAQVCRALREGEALVEYQVTDEAVYAFVFTSRRFLPVRLSAPPDEILEQARDLSSTIAVTRRGERAGNRAFFDWHFSHLGRALLGDLPLEGVRRLVLVPHGELHRVPFPALRLGGRYLVERCAVSLAPSASVFVTLAEKAGRTPAPGRCLLVKDPTGTLRHVDAEEAALRARFGKDLDVLAGDDATREAVLKAAPAYGALHFATHAVYSAERPEFSRLEMAGGQKLYAGDILGLDLSSCRLVTLSACDSGLGDFSHADELFGLPRAFLRAGAGSVLAALWPVEDHPSIGSFMREFYGFPIDQGPGAALRAAQKLSLAASSPATLWASFVMVGA